jgi:hypothetical protein
MARDLPAAHGFLAALDPSICTPAEKPNRIARLAGDAD